MFYKCNDCGHIFEEGEQVTWVEDYGEKFSGCPICKGTYEEIYLCTNCDSMASKRQGDFCKQCIIDVSKKLKTFLDDLTETEREILNELDWGEMM